MSAQYKEGKEEVQEGEQELNRTSNVRYTHCSREQSRTFSHEHDFWFVIIGAQDPHHNNFKELFRHWAHLKWVGQGRPWQEPQGQGPGQNANKDFENYHS